MIRKILNISLEDLKLINFFYQYIRPYKTWLVISVLTIPIATATTLSVPWFTARFFDKYLINRLVDDYYQLLVVFGVAILIGYLSDAIYTYSLQRAGQLAIASIRSKLFSHTLDLPRPYFDKTAVGITLSRITSDLEAVGESLAIGVLSLFADILKTVFLLGFLLYLNWKLTLVILTILPVIITIISVLRKKLRFYFNLTRESLAKATAFLHESLNGIKTIQLYAAEKKVLEKFKERNFVFFKAQCKSNIFDASLYSIIDGITTIGMVLVIWQGAILAKDDLISVGVLIAFINILSKIFIPIREFAQQISLIQRALSALQHVYLLFSEPAEDDHRQAQLKLKNQTFNILEFDKVSFRYSPDSEMVLNNVSFTLHKGQRIAIVGATGSGKSTILKLITQVYRDYQGVIKINDTNISLIDKKSLLSMISYMHQDAFLFEESIAFNIGLKRSYMTQGKIKAAAEYVFAHKFIQHLPEKYDFQINQNGTNLSAGQGQLITFARAIAAESSLILLDEATSSVDSMTENLIQKAIEKIFENKTVIAIAHRLSTIKSADLILVIENGQIIETGNHNELLERNKAYVKLLSSFGS